MFVNVGRMRQVAVVLAWAAAGLLLGGLLHLQVERMIVGDSALWTRSTDF